MQWIRIFSITNRTISARHHSEWNRFNEVVMASFIIILMHTNNADWYWSIGTYMANQFVPMFDCPYAHYNPDNPQLAMVENMALPYDSGTIKKEEFVSQGQSGVREDQGYDPPRPEQSQGVPNPSLFLKTEEDDAHKIEQVIKPEGFIIDKVEDAVLKVSHRSVKPVKEEEPLQELAQHHSLKQQHVSNEQIVGGVSANEQSKQHVDCTSRLDRQDRQGLNEATLQRFRNILKRPIEENSYRTIVEVYQQQLEEELRKEGKKYGAEAEAYVLGQVDLARRNMTQKYMRIYRLTLRILDKSMYDQESMGMLQGLLSRSVTSISTILKIYREPAFQFFVDFLKKEVVTPERFPHFIMALPAKHADKFVMLGGISGMVHAINNPNVTIRSWYIDPTLLAEDTSHIAQAVQQHRIGNKDIVKMLEEVYAKVLKIRKQSKSKCLYGNIASRFATIIHQAIGEMRTLGLLKESEELEIKQASKQMVKSASIATIKEVLILETLRAYLKTNFIDSGRLVIQILEDPSLNCRTKLGIMGSYENFCRAVSDPKTLKKWQ